MMYQYAAHNVAAGVSTSTALMRQLVKYRGIDVLRRVHIATELPLPGKALLLYLSPDVRIVNPYTTVAAWVHIATELPLPGKVLLLY